MRHLRFGSSFLNSLGACRISSIAKFISAALLVAFSSMSMANTLSWGPFNGTVIDDETGLFLFPSVTPEGGVPVEDYAGFANDNADAVPVCFGSEGAVDFTASVPSGETATLQFKFEKAPWPDVNPNFAISTVAVDSSEAASYTVAIPAYANDYQTFSSILLYVEERDVEFDISDVVVTSSDCGVDPTASIPASAVPTDDEGTVLSIFSDAYIDQEGTDFNPPWGQSTQFTAGDTLKYTNLNYQGTVFDQINVAGYDYLNVDFYAVDATDLKMFLIRSQDSSDVSYDLTSSIVLDEWVSVQIPLSHYAAGVNLYGVDQIKVEGAGTVHLDNIFFGNNDVAQVPSPYSIELTLSSPSASGVYLNTSLWDFDDNFAIEALSNGDGTWTAVIDELDLEFEYRWISDENGDFLEEDLLAAYNAGSCDSDGLVSDGTTYASRAWALPADGIIADAVVTGDIYNACTDFDADDDGVNDDVDAFPNDPNETIDTDNDGIGNNADADDDGDGVDDVNDPLPLVNDPDFTNIGQAAFAEAFGGTDIGTGLVYTFPTGAQSWGGFANLNTSLYPITVSDDSVITFTGSVPAGGDADVRFKLERLAHNANGNGAADTEPSFNTAAVTVSGSDAATYSVCVPAQGDKTFSSFLMYLDTRDLGVAVSEVAISADATCADTGGTDPEPPVSATIALPVDFEEAAANYEIAGFDGGVASVEAGPDGAVSLKYVKGAGQNWAGVWINLDTAVDSANGEVMTADVYSTEARDITLKFDAANVERVASHTGSGWEALSYDFTGAMPADQTKIAFFNDLSQQGDGTDAWTIYIDNLAQTSGGVAPGPGATIALPVDFEEAPADYEIAGFDGGVASVEAGPDGAVSLKYVKGAGQNWAGVWINLDTAVDAANGEVMTAAVHSTVARDITLKFDAANVERAASHTGSGWEALSYDFTGAMPADQTKIAFFNDLTQQGDGGADWTIYIDNLAQTTGGDTGGGDTGGTDTGPKDVTFSVDMTGVDLTDGNPTLQSTFNDWCGACNPMSDDDGDNIWTVTVNIPQGDHEYKYALGAWVSQESVPADCDNTLGANRAVTVTGDVTLATDVYNGCPGDDPIGGDAGPKDVTFSVDMTGVDLTDGNPTLQSTFNGWCGACNPMSDDDGDNIWTVTVNIPQGDHEYKYALGAWVSQESVPADCDNTLGANRAVTVTGDVTLATDVYNGCPGDDTSVVYTPADGFVIAEAFGDTVIDGSLFTFPAAAQAWGGFANMNTSLYPMTVTEDSAITFTGSVPAGGDADVRFKLERLAHDADGNGAADTEPSFSTAAVTVTGADAATYSVCVPAQGDKTFSSFLMYLDTRDVGVSVTDIAISADATCADTGGTDPEPPVSATIALPVDFEEAAANYVIAGFDGGVASVEAGPDGAVSLKYVKGAGAKLGWCMD
jgi:hypothetical protein